jgi:tRNA A-37 threonylcarbamoyl transferase component Bud32
VIADRYELVEELSTGGMGRVWRGYDTVLDRPVAVKRIRSDVVGSDEQARMFADRFRREARVTARINHPGVPQVYDAVLDDAFEHMYLVMELVDGVTQSAILRSRSALPVAWAASVAAQMCTVLSYAHAIPAVHRDIKPGNVMVAADGTVKLLDFGVAAILRSDVTRITEAGAHVGTARYMAPEQIKDAQVSPQTDLYALGCVLHEMLAGRPLAGGHNEAHHMYQHLNKDPRPLRQIRADVPEELERLVLDLLRKIPEQRPADAQEVFARLLPFLPERGAAGVAVGEAAPDGMPDPTRPYRAPSAPRARTAPAEAEAAPATRAEPAPAADPTGVRNVIAEAFTRSGTLLDDGRFTQAAEVLQDAIDQAAPVVGPENARVLKLRQWRAAALELGGDIRRALPEFDRLAAAFARTGGPRHPEALACRRQAAYCRAQLGETATALRQFRDVLEDYRAVKGDGDESVVELRHDIVMLLLAEQRIEEVLPLLADLHTDLAVLYGPDHDKTREIAHLIERLRRAEVE